MSANQGMIRIAIRTALSALVEEIHALAPLPPAERIVRSGWAADRAQRAIEAALGMRSPPAESQVENSGEVEKTRVSTTTESL